jgi:hypothetical protein
MEKIGEASKPLEARLAELNVSSQKTVVNSPLPKVLCIKCSHSELSYFEPDPLKHGRVVLYLYMYSNGTCLL